MGNDRVDLIEDHYSNRGVNLLLRVRERNDSDFPGEAALLCSSLLGSLLHCLASIITIIKHI